MRSSEIRKVLKTEPFEPFKVCLSDGRSVMIRHPRQAVVSKLHFFVGLAHLERTKLLRSPDNGDDLPKDSVFLNVAQVATIEKVK